MILAIYINVFSPLLCLLLKHLVPLGSCKTNSQNFADGSLPKREQKRFYLDMKELVHQEKKTNAINSDRRQFCIIHAKNESNLGLGSRFAPPSYTHSSSSSSLVKLQKRVTAVCIQKPYITPPPLRTITNPIGIR